MKPGIVILAAGESSRMGTPKQLLMYAGETLLQRTINAAQAVAENVIVVLGANAQAVARASSPSAVNLSSETNAQELSNASRPTGWKPVPQFVENHNWREGMGTSVSLGLRTLLEAHPDTKAVIFLLCDQPLLSSEILQQIIAQHEATDRPIVAAEYNGTLGVPALFAASLFPALLDLTGAEGARKVIKQHRPEALGVPFPAGAMDIDTPADYAQLAEIPLSPNLILA